MKGNDRIKIGLVLSSALSGWVSCRVIGSNLLKSYQTPLMKKTYPKQITFFDYKRGLGHKAAQKLAQEILDKGITHLHFLDHLPHPLPLISALIKKAKPEQLPVFCFHVYGDFTFYAPEWWALSQLLGKCRSHFLCASDRQIKMVQRLINIPESAVSLCPFPVDTDFYKFSEVSRRQGRKQFKIADKDLVVLYTGRLSMQKNVAIAIQETFKFFANKNRRIKFLLAGNFDDIGAPFFGIRPAKGRQFQEIENLRISIPKSQGEVQWIGSLSANDLRKAYNAADLFISLSLYHDEDFGMSPAEAIACGLPSVLSDWGGYSNFAQVSKKVHLASPKIDRQGYYFSSKDIQAALAKAYQDVLDKPRTQDHVDVIDKIGVQGVSKNIIAQIPDLNFHKVKAPPARLKKLTNKMLVFRQHEKPYVFKDYKDTFYLDLYKPYYEKKKLVTKSSSAAKRK